MGYQAIIHSIVVTGTELVEDQKKTKSYTLYTLELVNPFKRWSVKHRFSDFVDFDGKVRRTYPMVQYELPPKTYFGSNTAPEVVSLRKLRLEAYCQNLVEVMVGTLSRLDRRFWSFDRELNAKAI